MEVACHRSHNPDMSFTLPSVHQRRLTIVTVDEEDAKTVRFRNDRFRSVLLAAVRGAPRTVVKKMLASALVPRSVLQ